MVTKPIVQTLEDHQALAKAAKEKNVLVAVEVHKRLDPFYADARDCVRAGLGDFQYMVRDVHVYSTCCRGGGYYGYFSHVAIRSHHGVL